MKKNLVALNIALAGLVAVAPTVMAQGKDMEKCYGVAKKGANDCGNLQGTHSCGNKAKVDNDPGEWKHVAKGTCKKMEGGMTEAEAKEKLKAAKS